MPTEFNEAVVAAKIDAARHAYDRKEFEALQRIIDSINAHVASVRNSASKDKWKSNIIRYQNRTFRFNSRELFLYRTLEKAEGSFVPYSELGPTSEVKLVPNVAKRLRQKVKGSWHVQIYPGLGVAMFPLATTSNFTL